MIRSGRVYRTTRTISRSSTSDSESEQPIRSSFPHVLSDRIRNRGSEDDTIPTTITPRYSTKARRISVSGSGTDSESDNAQATGNSRRYQRTTEEDISGSELNNTLPIPQSINPRQYRTTVSISSGDSEDEETQAAIAEIYPMEGFPYPTCWDSDNYMDFLMGSFRFRSSNPVNFDAKMKFWQEMISVYGLYKRNAIFNKRELLMVFRRGKQVPYCLDKVIEEMIQTKQLRIRSEYEYNPSNNWISWVITNFVNKPLTWGFRKIPFIGGGEEDPADIEYVHLDVIRVFCEDVQKLLQKYVGQIQNFEILEQEIKEELNLQDDCIEMCLQTLHTQGRIGLEYIMEDNKKRIHLIKIPGESDLSIQITQTNRAVYNLHKTQKKLMQNLAAIEEGIKVNEERARQYIKEGKKQLAKTYLRKKLLLEKSHEKRSLALHNIETLICNVEEAQTNGVIMDAYKIGSKALHNLLNASGLKYDNVDEVISEVRETIDTHNDLQESLANVNIGESVMGSNDDELESELKKIVDEQTDEGAKTAAAVKFPESLPVAEQGTTAKQMDKRQHGNTQVDGKASESHQPAEISDAELLAMLEGLEVEGNSPVKMPEISKTTIT